MHLGTTIMNDPEEDTPEPERQKTIDAISGKDTKSFYYRLGHRVGLLADFFKRKALKIWKR